MCLPDEAGPDDCCENGPPFHRHTIQWPVIPQGRCQTRGIALPIARQAQITDASNSAPINLTRQRTSERVGDNQYRQQDACPARATATHGPPAGHSRRLALPPKPWLRAPASPSEYHPASSPSKIAQSERTGERLWYHRRHFARMPCQW